MIKIIMEHDERIKDIIKKAEKLFAKKGYDNTSVADIIEKVGIAKGTFYHYFKSKDELLDTIVGRMMKKIIWLVVSCLMIISLIMKSCGGGEEETVDGQGAYRYARKL